MKERTPSVEAAGVGRSILSTIQDRAYAKKESGKIDWQAQREAHRSDLRQVRPAHDSALGQARLVRAGMEVTEQDETGYCENRGREMVLKKGRFGQFSYSYSWKLDNIYTC